MIQRSADFKVDPSKCTGCGRCLEVCPGNMTGGHVLQMENGIPVMHDQTKFGWRGCWRCQHCLAVCPEGAISVLGMDPDAVPAKPDSSIGDELSRLYAYRRTCRKYKDQDVSRDIIEKLIQAVSDVPTGGNSYGLSFSIVESRKAMQKLYNAMFPYHQMELFDQNHDIGKLGIYNAPHLFIAHKVVGRRFQDGDLTELGIATAYFELLANAYGLGTVITNYGAEQIMKSKEGKQLLNIPEDHTALAIVGFGYSAIPYQRGVIKHKKVYRLYE